MQYMTLESARESLDQIMDNVTRFNVPVTIVQEKKAIVILSDEEWRGIQETLYLQSIPGMVESIKTAASEPLISGVDASEINWDV
jgi:PHD/YefM family antitoxin component YafN of YafNO toxin-antitoxin module